MATALTEQELKKISGEFDLESVSILDLSNQGLRVLGSLPLCTGLVILNLSHNRLTSVTALASLTSLMWLELMDNQITALDGFEALEKLETLGLAGNCLTSIDSLLPLASLCNLRKLTLSHPSPSSALLTNPLCDHPSYTAFKDSPTSYIPSLLWLEGEHVGGTFHVRTRQLCASVGKSGGPEQSSNQMSKKIDDLPDPLTNFSLDKCHELDKWTALVSSCRDGSHRVDKELADLEQHLNNVT